MRRLRHDGEPEVVDGDHDEVGAVGPAVGGDGTPGDVGLADVHMEVGDDGAVVGAV